MRAGGLDDGEYQLGGAQMITVTGGEARTTCGSLAGSTCSLDQALRNMVFESHVPEWEAVQMASSVPANYLGACSPSWQYRQGNGSQSHYYE